ncbi:MAG: prolipoprotein diacylglyceryl transferase [Chloroflexi bacterium]|nr:MAG: prolipoprotein diacylglyceryl transferase [Chloroflexota bacterium]
MMFPLLQLGPLALQVPGLFLIGALLLGARLAEGEARRQGRSPEALSNLIFYGLVSGIVGARLGYVLRYLDTYLANPRGILSLNPSALDLRAGVIACVIVMFFYGRRKHLALRATLDQLTPLLAALAVGIGLANLASGNAYGSPTDLPWAIHLWDAERHPSQIYESVAALLILVVVWRSRRAAPYPGFSFLLWLALISAARLFLEAFRGDSVFVAGRIRQAQVVALGVLLLSLWLMRYWYERIQSADG